MATTNDLVQRYEALSRAVLLSRGRVPEPLLASASLVVSQADDRLKIAGDDTVVALGGSTGSGKSSLFNAISQTQLATPGVRRPTTSHTLGAYWGTELPTGLFDWLAIPERHVVTGGGKPFKGLVLLDLPDHDSTELSHREEVDRVVQLVDMFVWVVDPQKYADAALHEQYLKPLAPYAELMVVALNQIDMLNPAQRRDCERDLRRLLDSEGLEKARMVSCSTVTGEGIEELRSQMKKAVKDKSIVAKRRLTDIREAAATVRESFFDQEVGQVPRKLVTELVDSFEVAAGVPRVTEAVLGAMRHRGSIATGWPLVAWLGRFKPDPLRRLRLDRPVIRSLGKAEPAKEIEDGAINRSSLPKMGATASARMQTATRSLADAASADLPTPWRNHVREAARSDIDLLADNLDAAVVKTDLDTSGKHAWWTVVKVLQWVLLAAVVVGVGWLLVDFALAYFRLPALPPVEWWGWPAQYVLLGLGALSGIVLGFVSRGLVELGARAKARAAHKRLRAAVAAVAQEHVVDPVNAELVRYEQAREMLDQAAS